MEAEYWQALNPKGAAQNTGTDGPSANAKLCEVYYFHTDQVGLPEELSNAQGQIIWQAQYKTWGSTVEERWEARRLHGAKVQGQTEGDIPQEDRQEQNLRFQGQYLDRETGLHYNTFRYYDADIGRFISPDPIGLNGGINLGTYAPNSLTRADPLGLVHEKTPGYSVYHIYAPGQTPGIDKPYYVGITEDSRIDSRRNEHRRSGRLPQGAKLVAVEQNVTYGEARGIERAHIERYGTNTGKNGANMKGLPANDYSGRGNRNLGFDVNSKLRPDGRQSYFQAAYEKAGGAARRTIENVNLMRCANVSQTQKSKARRIEVWRYFFFCH